MGLGSDILGGTAQGLTAGTAVAPGPGTAVGGGVGALIGLVTGLMAYYDEQEATEKARKILADAQNLYGSIDDSAIRKAASNVVPPTVLNSITTNPEYGGAVREGLRSLKGISDAGGLTTADRAVQENALARSAQEERATREGILNREASRGMRGSGAELAALLQAGQSGANRDAATSLETAGTAQQRALQALRDRASLGLQAQGQEWNQKSAAASAQDAINRFNVSRADQLAQQNWNNQFLRAGAQAGLMGGQAGLTQQGGMQAGAATRALGRAGLGLAGDLGMAWDRSGAGGSDTPLPATGPFAVPLSRLSGTDDARPADARATMGTVTYTPKPIAVSPGNGGAADVTNLNPDGTFDEHFADPDAHKKD